MTHPTGDRLEAWCDGSLADAERAAVGSHLSLCSQCRSEVEDWRAVFAALSALPRFSARAGFTERVMARVRIADPWHARAGAVLSRMVPRTTPGWGFAAAALSVPMLLIGGIAAWLLSKSYVTAHGLWVFATDRFAEGANQMAAGAAATALQSDVAAWVVASLTRLFASAGTRGVGGLALAAATGVVLSAWILYRNVLRSPARGTTNVTYNR